MNAQGEDASRLPEQVASQAITNQLALHELRIRTLYNRHRALYAESVVAALLPGAEEVDDPTAAWDVTWRPDGQPIRIQVKCSGGFLPRSPDRTRVAPAVWTIETPKKGWDPDGDDVALWNLGAGHHCHVFVLARHVGNDVDDGWSFAAVPTALIAEATTRSGAPRTRFPASVITGLGHEFVVPQALAASVRAAAGC